MCEREHRKFKWARQVLATAEVSAMFNFKHILFPGRRMSVSFWASALVEETGSVNKRAEHRRP
jgi:hypothetical protein